MQITTSVMEKP